MYKIVQTGAKTQLGGLKKGFCKVINQVLTDDCVAKLESNPTNTQADMAVIVLTVFVFFNLLVKYFSK